MKVRPMSFDTLVSELEAYYGGPDVETRQHYGDAHLGAFMDEFDGRDDLFLGSVYAVTVMRFSTKWKVLPDLAAINEFRSYIEQFYTDALRTLPSLPAPQMSEEDRAATAKFLRDLLNDLAESKKFSKKPCQPEVGKVE